MSYLCFRFGFCRFTVNFLGLLWDNIVKTVSTIQKEFSSVTTFFSIMVTKFHVHNICNNVMNEKQIQQDWSKPKFINSFTVV